jgi:hypothetical protein
MVHGLREGQAYLMSGEFEGTRLRRAGLEYDGFRALIEKRRPTIS